MEVHSNPIYQNFSAPQPPIDFSVPLSSPVLQDILADVSHELKTPLSSIRNSLTLLKIGAAGPISKDAQEVLDVVERSTIRLIDLVEEILNAQRPAPKLETISTDELVIAAVEMVSGELRSKELKLLFARSNLHVRGNEKRLLQVLVNLLSNAIKFSPAGGYIKIQARAENNQMVEISVTDEGAGIVKQDLDRIFRRHEQGPYLSDLGTGLGLSITKQIIEEHQGQIGASDNSEGGGATFWIRLPRSM
ncbi:MAG TPA: HAMP domain-containing sensor histidine kinase [Oculatellaceae cyanobacterium]|jgi:signal transduction histidine kinase